MAPVHRHLLILYICAALILARWISASADVGPTQWVRVVRDANYDIAIDTARVRRGLDRSWTGVHPTSEVWYRTDHKLPRLHEGKLFTREIVHSIVRCDSLWFKVISVDMSMGDKRPMAVQRLTPDEVAHEVWHRIEFGAAEEMAAQAACHFAGKRPRE